MSQTIAAASHRDGSVASRQRHPHGWEDWEDDDDVITLIDMAEPTPAYAAKEAAVMRNKSRSPAASSSRFSLSPTNDSPPDSILEHPPQHPPQHPPLSHRPGQGLTVPSNSSRNIKRLSARASRQFMGKISRPASRRRQKSATSTLRLITDMSKIRRTNHANPQIKSPEVRPPKFVDAAALAALEGEPTSASTGNWSWLKRSRLQSPETSSRGQTVRSPDQELSPEDRPIVIGIALPSDEAASHEMSPQTAAASSHPPIDQQMTRLALPGLATGTSNPFAEANQLKSVWSPDTPDTACSFNSVQRSSSVYSQMTIPGLALGPSNANTRVPPVPALPANYQQTPQKRVIGEEESGSPCTLFEEDASPTVRRSLRSLRAKLSAVTPGSATPQGDGWWDHHVVTPFLDRSLSLASRVQKAESSGEDKGAHRESVEAQVPRSWEPQESLLLLPPLAFQSTQYVANAPGENTGHQLDLGVDNGLGISFPTTDGVATQGNRGRPEQGGSCFSATPTSQPKASSQQSKLTAAVSDDPRTKVSDWDETAPGEKSHRLAPEGAKVDIPPPYSPLRKQAVPVSYQAVFPPDHATKTLAQSRHKGAPGLASTLTSQGVGRGTDHAPAELVTKRSIEEDNAIPGPSSAPQANKQAAAIVRLPGESRFADSPSSMGSSTLGDGFRPTELHIVAAQPVEGEPGFHHDLGSLPRNPARPFLAHQPVTAPPEPCGYGYTMPLPARQAGTYLPEEHGGHDVRGTGHKVERQRRRHEKEDVVARRVGGIWRGRGCVPSRGCFGRSGREGRKKRRIWLGVMSAVIAVIVLAVVLGLVLARHGTAQAAPSIWVNLTEYPPMPTGVLTFVGPDNTVARSGCTEPSTLWSCSLPKDAQASVAPYRANQPTMVFQIQWDNSSSNGWRVPNGNAPAAVERDSGGPVDGFQPTPSPPSYGEMWFLGETTDGIVSGEKAGEPTPFFISVLQSVNDTQGPVKRASASPRATGSNRTFSSLLPPPDLEADGTPTAAVMLPNPRQQPVRLFDRGLATEHYGFYTHFKRTIYVKSVTVLNTTEGNVPLDEDGGCRKSEANYLVTWAQTRMLVQIWTRRLGDNTTGLLGAEADAGGSARVVRPGTMPYPVTVTLDTHGGDPRQKLVWEWPMDGRQRLALDKGELLANNMAAGGTWVNHRGSGDVKWIRLSTPTVILPQQPPMRPLPSCRAALCRATTRRVSRDIPRPLVTLAIETSCDDTAVAVLSRADADSNRSAELLFNRRVSSDNRAFGGINPKIAVESHNARLAPLVRAAISLLPASSPRPDFVSVTRGPGIAANLAVGLNVAKGLCAAWDVPLLAVHHMQAHALTPRLVTALSKSSSSAPSAPGFPFLSLLVSGGHTLLLLSSGPTEHRVIATTADIAVGNMLDQTARVILPRECLEDSPDVMYARALERFAFPQTNLQDANLEDATSGEYGFFRPAASRHAEMFPEDDGLPLPLPLRDSRKLAFSFSSIHSRVHAIAAADPHMPVEDRRMLARHTLRAAFQHLVGRLVLALEDSPLLADCRDGISTLVVAGGVASNSFLMHVLRATLDVRGFARLEIVRPPVELCTDNAAMIAWAGMEMYDAGWRSDLSVLPIAKWPMDGRGIMGVDGWVKVG